MVAGDELLAVDGLPVDPVRGPWPLLAGTAGKPVELTILPRGDDPPQTPPDHGGAPRPPIPPWDNHVEDLGDQGGVGGALSRVALEQARRRGH